MHAIKLVTFDATNTLLHFKKPPWHHYAMVASQHGIKCSEDKLKVRLKDSLQSMLDKYPNFGKSKMPWQDWWRKVVKLTLEDFITLDQDTTKIADKLIEDYRSSKCWAVADGADHLLQQLRRKNVSLGVISNFDPRLNEILTDVNLLKYFDFIITSYDAGCSKPDKNIFVMAMNKSRIPVISSEVLHVGDDLKKDYHGAREAGCHAILINPNCDMQMQSLPLNHVFKDLKELNSVIEKSELTL